MFFKRSIPTQTILLFHTWLLAHGISSENQIKKLEKNNHKVTGVDHK